MYNRCFLHKVYMSGLTKQARVINSKQEKHMLLYLATTRYPIRNKVIFLLSLKAGLRATEIAHLCWKHVLTDDSQEISNMIRITNDIAKGAAGGRQFHMANDLREALKNLYESYSSPPRQFERIIENQQKIAMTPKAVALLFLYWYRNLGWHGYSSHSGRRTFITRAAQKISLCGGSINDVRKMAGHNQLASTQKYIEANTDAQKLVVNMI